MLDVDQGRRRWTHGHVFLPADYLSEGLDCAAIGDSDVAKKCGEIGNLTERQSQDSRLNLVHREIHRTARSHFWLGGFAEFLFENQIKPTNGLLYHILPIASAQLKFPSPSC